MEKNNLKITIEAPEDLIREDGKFDIDKAYIRAGHYAGVCYDEEGLEHLKNERLKTTFNRANMTLKNGHHSVYDHIRVTLNIEGIPKILAMVLNNEHDYTTSEKSARYTPVKKSDDSIITDNEVEIYEKWLKKFEIAISSSYGNVFNKSKIVKLAQENARYMVTVFMPTKMVYTTSIRQLNYIASWMQKYIGEHKDNGYFNKLLTTYMEEFVAILKDLNMCDKDLMRNEKNRGLSLFGQNISSIKPYFGDSLYITKYQGSFAEFAQAQRHRTLDYQLELLEESKCFIPPIIEDNAELVKEWINDYQRVADVIPQGTLVNISESGTYDMFILKCKERLCSAAQLEINNQTRETLIAYHDYLKQMNSEKVSDIEKYMHGARCTFPDYTCPSLCHFNEGINLTRKI